MSFMKKKENELSLLWQLGKRIAFLRKQRGLTQLALSIESGLALSFVSDLERGKRNPSIETLWKIAKALDVSLEELLRGIVPIE